VLNMPASVEIESALLSRLMVTPTEIPTLSLGPDDFYDSDMRAVWGAMQSITRDGRPVDVMTIADQIGRSVQLPVLSLTAGHNAPLDEYAAILKDRTLRRELLHRLKRVESAAYDLNTEPLVVLADVFTEMLAKGNTDKLYSSAKVAERYSATLAHRRTSHQSATGLTWGIPGLDDILLPADEGELIILSALTSVGKTAAAENITDHWQGLGRGPVLFASLEMSQTQLWDRGVARTSGVSAEKIIRSDMVPTEEELVEQAIRTRSQMAIEYLDDPFATTAAIRAAAAKTRILHRGLLAGIVVDYLQIINDKNENEVQRLTDISRRLKAIAREQRVPLVAMAQFNRGASEDDPQLFNLKGSGSIEQNADVVLSLIGRRNDPIRIFRVLKQRQGKLGEVRVRYTGDTVTFSSEHGDF